MRSRRHLSLRTTFIPVSFSKHEVQCSSWRRGCLARMRAMADISLLHDTWPFPSKEVGCGKQLLWSALPETSVTASAHFPFIGRLFCILSKQIFASVAFALCNSSPIYSSSSALLLLQHLNHHCLMTPTTFYLLYPTIVTSPASFIGFPFAVHQPFSLIQRVSWEMEPLWWTARLHPGRI